MQHKLIVETAPAQKHGAKDAVLKEQSPSGAGT